MKLSLQVVELEDVELKTIASKLNENQLIFVSERVMKEEDNKFLSRSSMPLLFAELVNLCPFFLIELTENTE